MDYLKSYKLFESVNYDREVANDILLPLKDNGLNNRIQFQGPGYTSPHPETGAHEKKIVCYINIDYFLANKINRVSRSFTLSEIKGDGEVNRFIQYMLSCGYPLIRCRIRSGDWDIIWEEPDDSDMSGKDIPIDIFESLPDGIRGYENYLSSFELVFKWGSYKLHESVDLLPIESTVDDILQEVRDEGYEALVGIIDDESIKIKLNSKRKESLYSKWRQDRENDAKKEYMKCKSSLDRLDEFLKSKGLKVINKNGIGKNRAGNFMASYGTRESSQLDHGICNQGYDYTGTWTYEITYKY